MSVLMKCGHTTQGYRIMKDGTKKPVCIICDCEEIVETKPDLTGRKARCSYYGYKCNSEVNSSYHLAFFKHKPNCKYDEYYCGCWGWS